MKSNTRFNSNTKGIECLNCKQPLDSRDHFCSNCGQVNDLEPLSIKQYLKEFFAGFFAFDTRTLNTIVPLLFKPGKVAKDYVEGRRMKYVNPFQFYFHTSIVFFLVMSIYMSIDDYNTLLESKTNTEKTEILKDSTAGKKIEIGIIDVTFSEKEVAEEIEKPLDSIPYTIASQVDTFLLLAKTKKLVLQKTSDKAALKKQFFNSVYEAQKTVEGDFSIALNDTISELYLRKMFYDTLQTKINKQHLELALDTAWRDKKISTFSSVFEHSFEEKINDFNEARSKNAIVALDSMGYEVSRWNVLLFNKIQNLKNIGKDNSIIPQLIKKMISKFSIVLFIILPFFTLFVHLLYYRKHKTYTEHLIFVFNTQAVFLLLLLFSITFDRILDTYVAFIFVFIIFIIYLYKALRYFYNQKRWVTVLKMLIMTFVYYVLTVFGTILASTLAFFDDFL